MPFLCLYINVKNWINDWTQVTQTGSTTHMQPNNMDFNSTMRSVALPQQLLPVPQLYHIPLTLALQGLFGVLLGEGEADRLRRLLTLSQMHPSFLSPQVVIPTSRSILPTNLWARSVGQMESRVVGSDRAGLSSSCGRTRQCKEERQLPGPKPPSPTSPPPPPPLPSQLRSSEGADKKVVQNIIVAADWAWAIRWQQAQMETPGKIGTGLRYSPSVKKDISDHPQQGKTASQTRLCKQVKSTCTGFFFAESRKPRRSQSFTKKQHRK